MSDALSSERLSIEKHPDITELRDRYDRAGSSSTAQAIDGLTLMAGLYVAMSPWIVGFSSTSTLKVNDLITGIAVSLLALGFASAFGRTHGVAWTTPLLGVWVIISPWVVSGVSATTSIVVSSVISGAAICLLGLSASGFTMMRDFTVTRKHTVSYDGASQ
ncbi:MAG: SPW repeat protein [Nocardioidaceae bacterium]